MDFEAQPQLRDKEIDAIKKLVQILSSKALNDNVEKHLPSTLLQKFQRHNAACEQWCEWARVHICSFDPCDVSQHSPVLG